MIHFVVTEGHSAQMSDYLAQEWGWRVAARMQVLLWGDLFARSSLPAGTWVFSDLDRLTPAEREAAEGIADRLQGESPAACVLNHPRRVKLRYELLRSLAESGRNRFGIVPAARAHELQRFPIFLREADEHTGNLTPLLHGSRDLRRALFWVRAKGFRLRDLVAVEYCDTASQDGIYRKYAAYNVGGRILPRHLECSAQWKVRHRRSRLDEAFILEEREYVHSNPHESWLREVFELAGIEYGRADYSFFEGQPQLWEINLNPTVGRILNPPAGHLSPPEHVRELRLPSNRTFYSGFEEAWLELDRVTASRAGDPIRIEIPAELRERMRSERHRDRWTRCHRSAVRRARPLRGWLVAPIYGLRSLLSTRLRTRVTPLAKGKSNT